MLENVLSKLRGGPIALVTLENDDDVGNAAYDEKIRSLPIIGAWFTTNLVRKAPKLYPLPIGLNAWRQLDAMTSYLRKRRTRAKSKWLLVNFTPKRPERQHIIDLARTKAWSLWSDVLDMGWGNEDVTRMETNVEPAIFQRRTPESVYDVMSQYRFVACPRGVGMDTHRTWETLYLGSVPILLRSSLTVAGSDMFGGLDVLVVDRWEDVTIQRLQLKWAEVQQRRISAGDNVESPSHEKLRLSYWSHKIRRAVTPPDVGTDEPVYPAGHFRSLPRLFSAKVSTAT